MPYYDRDGLKFRYFEEGEGIPFFFQHGLGGDLITPCALFSPPLGFRLLSFDFRGHGETRPLGDPDKLRFACFAEDFLALMDHLSLSTTIVGGISMGAAVALKFTLQYPERVLGLVLSRPAWLEGPNLRNKDIFTAVAELIRQHSPNRAKELFKESEIYTEILSESTDSAKSLLEQFNHPRAVETVEKLERIPNDAPCHDLKDLESILTPTLVLANHRDPVHPYEFGEALAQKIPGAEFREMTPKSVDLNRHAQDVQSFIEEFLKRNFVTECRSP